VVFAGAPGVGKTRLAREVLDRAAVRGVTPHWFVATEAARSVPLGPFATVRGDVSRDVIGLVRQVVAALRSAPGHVVVGVDDAHLLDAASALMVHQLVHDGRVTVVATVRAGEPAPDAVTAPWKDGHLPRVELRSLSADDSDLLVATAMGGSVEPPMACRLFEITRGNALCLRLLLDGQREAARMRLVEGRWRWTGPPGCHRGSWSWFTSASGP
jgi:predicted ATPase